LEKVVPFKCGYVDAILGIKTLNFGAVVSFMYYRPAVNAKYRKDQNFNLSSDMNMFQHIDAQKIVSIISNGSVGGERKIKDLHIRPSVGGASSLISPI